MRVSAILATSMLVLASCAGANVAPPVLPSPDPSPAPQDVVASAPPAPTATPEIRLYQKLRVFVTSESTDQVWVMEAAPDAPFEMVTKIPVGRMPHQIAVSPDGKYVAVNNRMVNSTSIIDPIAMKELIRIPVGKQPH
ncbi:MAG: hypothetical protein Q7S41_02950, partial [Candidatus Limnocylindria bacterium]|nr:hypothetical protein [Candidatus Limnocylindria bacterium]